MESDYVNDINIHNSLLECTERSSYIIYIFIWTIGELFER